MVKVSARELKTVRSFVESRMNQQDHARGSVFVDKSLDWHETSLVVLPKDAFGLIHGEFGEQFDRP